MLKLGTNNIDKIYLGDTKIAKAYLGDTLVYESAPAHDYSQDYLTFEALESGTFTLTIPTSVTSTYMTSISYSTDNGSTWVTTQVDNTLQTITTPTISKNNKVLWKGIGKGTASTYDKSSAFSSTGNFNLSGNIMSLLYGDNFTNKTTFPDNRSYIFGNLFQQSTKLVSAKNLILPATTLYMCCYYGIFTGCSSLTIPPKVLPATKLPQQSYAGMFSGCTSLTIAPKIYATILEGSSTCYYMFKNCTSLTEAPELYASVLSGTCYYGMFSGCSNLNYIKMLATNINANDCLKNWVQNVAASGTFVKHPNASLSTGVNGIPSGWTVQTASS